MLAANACWGPSCWSCDAPLVATDCILSSWHGWKADKEVFQQKCRGPMGPGKLVRWGEDSGVEDCGVVCPACSYIRACCDTCVTIKESTVGFWKSLACVRVAVPRTIEVGVVTTTSGSFEVSNTWKASVTASAESKAAVLGLNGTIGLSGTVAREQTRKWSTGWSKVASRKDTRSWTQPAHTCAWTWALKIVDSCGEREADTEHFELTPINNSPCCLPGMFADRDNKYGACHPDHSGVVINLCNGTITTPGLV